MPDETTRKKPDHRMQCMELRGGSGAVDETLRMPGIDASVFSRPYRQAGAGGDLHYVSTCATGRIARVLVADVSGHGAVVSSVAGRLHDLMVKYVNFVDQRRFFRTLNRHCGQMLADGMFATAVVMTYFAPTGTLSISSAGHPPPLLWRGKTRQWSFLIGRQEDNDNNLPLGVIDAARYDRFELSIGPDDLVLCYTDGLTESRDADGNLLGTEDFLRIAADIDGSEPADVVRDFNDALVALNPANLTGDDITLLAFKPNGGGAVVPLKDRLLAPARILRAAVSSLGQHKPAPWPELSITNIGGAMIDRLSHWKRS